MMHPNTSLCLRTYTVVIEIMNQLAPSDVSAFVHAVGLYHVVTDETLHRYMNLTREVTMIDPEIGPLMRSKNPVLIVGRDVSELVKMYRSPCTYWRVHRTRKMHTIWVMILNTIPITTTNPHPAWNESGYTVMNRDGTTNTIETRIHAGNLRAHPNRGSCKGLICNTGISASTVILPPMNRWPSCLMNETMWSNETWATAGPTDRGTVTILYATPYSNMTRYVTGCLHTKIDELSTRLDDMDVIPYVNLGINRIRYSPPMTRYSRPSELCTYTTPPPDEFMHRFSIRFSVERTTRDTSGCMIKEVTSYGFMSG